jgi:hypothetical protein
LVRARSRGMLAFKLASAQQQTTGVSCQVSHTPPPA